MRCVAFSGKCGIVPELFSTTQGLPSCRPGQRGQPSFVDAVTIQATHSRAGRAVEDFTHWLGELLTKIETLGGDVDPDEYFAYQTPKVVKIRHRSLGLLKRLFILGII